MSVKESSREERTMLTNYGMFFLVNHNGLEILEEVLVVPSTSTTRTKPPGNFQEHLKCLSPTLPSVDSSSPVVPPPPQSPATPRPQGPKLGQQDENYLTALLGSYQWCRCAFDSDSCPLMPQPSDEDVEILESCPTMTPLALPNPAVLLAYIQPRHPSPPIITIIS